jgi:Raf kinase inhibitor-like YbhB/YbcL family protein
MAEFQVRSDTFEDGETLPKSVAHQWAGGENRSPHLEWLDAPEGTKSFAVSMYDPDAPTPVGFVHWVLFNLPAEVTRLDEGAGSAGSNPAGSTSGYTDFGVSEFGGPAPPPGDPHRYQITVYALDVSELELDSSATYAFFRFSIRGHVLAEAQITGMFGV